MTVLVVETGANVSGANGYVTMEACATYAAARGLTFGDSPSTSGEQAIIRATAALDSIYRHALPGYKTNGRSQNLEWPRTAAYDREGLLIATTEIPTEVIQATCEMAVRELATPNSMMPDLERGGAIKSIRAGSVSIDYGANAASQTTYTIIDGLMTSLLGARQVSFVGEATRG